MPNTPALVGCGASVFTCGSAALPADGATAERLLGAVGIAHQVQEKLVDPVTALSGSGPAYVSTLWGDTTLGARRVDVVDRPLPSSFRNSVAVQALQLCSV